MLPLLGKQLPIEKPLYKFNNEHHQKLAITGDQKISSQLMSLVQNHTSQESSITTLQRLFYYIKY